MVLTAEQETLKEQLISLGETWSSAWEAVLEASVPYFKAYVKLRSVPIKNHKLPRKLQELILLACDASCTHLFLPGVQVHTQKALEAGASKEEILEILQQTSVLGIHAISIGLPILFEVLEEAGKITQDEINKPHDKWRAQLKADFQKQRGFWSAHYNNLLLMGMALFPVLARD
jgi:alkylhydroperoxidase/carboxymuconolactone decarboxylase family protein YurZ